MSATMTIPETIQDNALESVRENNSGHIPAIRETHVEIKKHGDLYEISIWETQSAEVVGSITSTLLATKDVWCVDNKISLGPAR